MSASVRSLRVFRNTISSGEQPASRAAIQQSSKLLQINPIAPALVDLAIAGTAANAGRTFRS